MSRLRGDQVFMVVMWVIVTTVILYLILLSLEGHGSTLGKFILWPLVFLVSVRLMTARSSGRDTAPPDRKNEE